MRLRRLGPARLLATALLAAGASSAVTPAVAQPEEPPQACTLIGCTDQVALHLVKEGDGIKVKDGVARLSFCVRDRCKRVGVKKWHDWSRVSVECDSETTLRAVLTAKDSAGRRLARYSAMVPVKKVQPNGPGCEPTCFQGGVRFNGAALVVAP